jgi:hypothetical protein
VKPIRDPQVMARMQATLELHQFARDVMRQNLRRRHPEENDEQIEGRLRDWLRKKPSTDRALVLREGGLGNPNTT